MRRGGVAIILGIIVLSSVLLQIENNTNYQTELIENNPMLSTSDVTITYSNGPDSGESVTGLFTVSFSLGGSGTVSSLLVEISDGITWTTVANLTSSPWFRRRAHRACEGGRRVRLLSLWGDDSEA